jgi:ABC-type dipeptide/oligopeptide/nickel transport system permease component
MLLIILRRLGQSVFVLFLVAFVSFMIFRYVGNPVDNLLGQEASNDRRDALIEALGLNDPLHVQYFSFVGRALQFDFGISYRTAQPVADMILQRLPATLELALVSAIFAIVLGVVAGVYTAINRRGVIANSILSSSLIGVSLPTFLIGVLLIWVFSVELKWLPSFGRGETVDLGFWKTGFLSVSGTEIPYPARHYAWLVSDDPHHAAHARRNAGSTAPRLYQIRPRKGLARPGCLLQPRTEKHAGARGDHRRLTAWLDCRLRHHYRNCLPVARASD